jgi:transcriptional antiterminator Rof (Rho-off)
MSDYQPISCAEHEALEFAVLRRRKLVLRWRDEVGEIRERVVLPVDVATRDQAEWLTCQDASGSLAVVRLDQIVSAVPI